jgi:DNA-damage-inducible protein J
MNATDTVRARIDSGTKAKASAALAAMGLSVSDAIRMMMHRIAEEKSLPFDVRVPNAASREALAELEGGKGKRYKTAEALFEDLGI